MVIGAKVGTQQQDISIGAAVSYPPTKTTLGSDKDRPVKIVPLNAIKLQHRAVDP
jgi:hypothetical protein